MLRDNRSEFSADTKPHTVDLQTAVEGTGRPYLTCGQAALKMSISTESRSPLLCPRLPALALCRAGLSPFLSPSTLSRTGHSLVCQNHFLPSHRGWHLCQFSCLPSPQGLEQGLAPRRYLVNIC
jgi:hypothetical protein